MNLLQETDKLDKTLTKRFRLKGITKEYQAYRIPLHMLKYNVMNDRIATFITQYLDEKGDLPEEIEKINDIIEDYIYLSNPDALKKTKNNLRIVGQTEVAVVTSDGIVIDGNRRFTTLRQLYKELGDEKFGYLEAVILDRGLYDEKDIKRLELNLQHAIESKVDYNPIERLVGIYRALIQDGHLFTIEEYEAETQISKKEVQKEIEIAKLLVEYLEFINQPEKFHIARVQKIDGPLREVYKILRSNKIDKEDEYDVKELLFANMLTLSGDITRKIRELKPIIEDKESREQLIEEAEDVMDDINDNLAEDSVQEIAERTGTVNIESNIVDKVNEITEKYVEANNLSNAKNQPLEALRKSLLQIEKVDKDAVSRFNGQLREEFEEYLNKILNEINLLKGITNAK